MTYFDLVFLALALIWVPHLVGFFQAWRERQNPISLAILFALLLVVYTNVFVVLHLHWRVRGDVEAWIYGGCSCLAAGYLYFAKSWSRVRFPDSRRPRNHQGKE